MTLSYLFLSGNLSTSYFTAFLFEGIFKDNIEFICKGLLLFKLIPLK